MDNILKQSNELEQIMHNILKEDYATELLTKQNIPQPGTKLWCKINGEWHIGIFQQVDLHKIYIMFPDGVKIILNPYNNTNIKIPSRWNLLLESIFNDIAQLKLAIGHITEEEHIIKMSYNIIKKFKILLQYKAINYEDKIKKYCQLLINYIKDYNRRQIELIKLAESYQAAQINVEVDQLSALFENLQHATTSQEIDELEKEMNKLLLSFGKKLNLRKKLNFRNKNFRRF